MSHLDQSASLMSILKISIACWMIAEENATMTKVAAATVRLDCFGSGESRVCPGRQRDG
jgi:hypothetical protein